VAQSRDHYNIYPLALMSLTMCQRHCV